MLTRSRFVRSGSGTGRRRPPWRSAHVAVALAGVVAATLTLAALRRAEHTVDVVAWSRTVVPGERLAPDDAVVVRIHADDAVVATLVRRPDDVVGSVSAVRAVRGSLVRRADLVAATSVRGRRTMSFPVSTADAVDGNLVSGDRIDVVATARDATRAAFALVDAPVRSVTQRDGIGGASDRDVTIVVTVEVDADDALRLVAAQAGGHLVVVRSTGARAERGLPLLDLASAAPEVLP